MRIISLKELKILHFQSVSYIIGTHYKIQNAKTTPILYDTN